MFRITIIAVIITIVTVIVIITTIITAIQLLLLYYYVKIKLRFALADRTYQVNRIVSRAEFEPNFNKISD